jgi:hypothetical protein
MPSLHSEHPYLSPSLANVNVKGRSGKAGTAGRTGKDKVETKNVRGGSKAGGVTRLPAGSKSSGIVFM